MGVDFRDYDDDGLPDLVYTALRGERTLLFHNGGDGLFDDAGHASGLAKLSVDASGWGVGLFDFDNDGRKDLFTALAHVNDTVAHFEPAPYRMHNRVYAGAAGGRFEVVDGSGLDEAPARAHRGAAFADFNRDGRVDVVVTSLGEPAELWENVSMAGGWLEIELEGSAANRDGLGAKVRADGRRDHATQAVGYASSSRVLQFGLGAASAVGELEVVWPSGRRQILRDVPGNQRLRVKEPR
jgi:hypothetical protein